MWRKRPPRRLFRSLLVSPRLAPFPARKSARPRGPRLRQRCTLAVVLDCGHPPLKNAEFGEPAVVSLVGGHYSNAQSPCAHCNQCAYFSLAGEHTPDQLRTAILRLSLFFFVAMLICWLNAALRAAQENLRRSELNFRSLVTNAPYGICRCDSTGKILDANPAFVELLGLG